MNRLEIKQMNELTTDFMTDTEYCDELTINITVLRNRLEELEKELEIANEKRTKAKQALEEQFNYLVGKANRKQARKEAKEKEGIE